MVEVEPGRVVIALRRRDDLTQQHGYLHAGVISTIADTAGGYAGLTRMEPSREVLSVEFKINFLAPAAGEWFEAVGTVIKSGRSLSVCRIEVFAVNEEQRKLVATGQQTLISVDA